MSTFYEAIAQVEIDEYRDYEKAANCLKDALKVLQKAQLEFEYAIGVFFRRISSHHHGHRSQVCVS